ncbi:Calcium-transporting ATPase 3, endoplasmic reticulum-type [Camellia lanceoleosa]|uniref:Calcium-transporting ATPase 3, endoplasmic reticulum-type n=1 Tax=Camellia lanceoleosa TaxID=1840588 RepID=A0ACC0I3B6_9ERIC|nr:Calcium-transporting ATPase 3, endoplasmic reticulum-type [Camellia lanceoleosa]
MLKSLDSLPNVNNFNMWLVGSIVLIMLLHILILYMRPLFILFSVTPLSWAKWTVVFYLSFPANIDLVKSEKLQGQKEAHNELDRARAKGSGVLSCGVVIDLIVAVEMWSSGVSRGASLVTSGLLSIVYCW